MVIERELVVALAPHRCLDNAQFILQESGDADDDLDRVAKRGIQQTSQSLPQSRRHLISGIAEQLK